jgi:hypothetical protein
MKRFETIINFALDAMQKGSATGEDTKAEILKAANRLLEDSAMEMAESTVNGILMILTKVYNDGMSPGPSNNPLLDNLTSVLAEAGHQKKHADHSAEDTY